MNGRKFKRYIKWELGFEKFFVKTVIIGIRDQMGEG